MIIQIDDEQELPAAEGHQYWIRSLLDPSIYCASHRQHAYQRRDGQPWKHPAYIKYRHCEPRTGEITLIERPGTIKAGWAS